MTPADAIPPQITAPPLRLLLAPRDPRLVAVLVAASLMLSGVDAVQTGSTVLGSVGIAAGSLGLLAVRRATRRDAFLRWSNAVNALVFAAVAAQKFAAGKIALPVLQVAAAALLLSIAVFDIQPRPGEFVADGASIVTRRTRFRRSRTAWREVTGLAIEGDRVQWSTARRTRSVRLAAPIAPSAAAQLRQWHAAATEPAS